jgi:hypothetical protein
VSGRVGLRLVDQGNYVTPGDATGIAVITQLRPISVVFTVAEDNLPQIVKRLRAEGTLPATAFNRTGVTKLATGELKTLDNQIDTTTGTLKLRAEFANEDEILFPNQFVNINLLVDVLHDIIIVPTSAIQTGPPGTFVYLVNADNTVAIRLVTLGPTNGDRVAVQSGLSAGDLVVIDGVDSCATAPEFALRNRMASACPARPAHPAPLVRRPAFSKRGRADASRRRRRGSPCWGIGHRWSACRPVPGRQSHPHWYLRALVGEISGAPHRGCGRPPLRQVSGVGDRRGRRRAPWNAFLLGERCALRPSHFLDCARPAPGRGAKR